MTGPVKFGFFVDFSLTELTGGTMQEWWLRLEDLCRELEELNYDFIWLGEHHFVEPGFTTNPLLSLAALARVTRKIGLGTYVILLPLYHPLRVAEDAATVDILSDGRLDLGLGLGYRQIEFETLGIPRAHRGAMLEEGVEIIRQAFTGLPVQFSGRHYQVPGVTVTPVPPRQPGPPIWLAARSEVAARRAGRLGLHLLLLGGGTIRRVWERELVAAGYDPATMMVTSYRPFFISRDPARDLQRLDPQFKYFGRRHGGWVGGDKDVSFDAVVAQAWSDDAIKGMNYLTGTPDDALEELKAYYDRKPFTHYVAPIPPPYDLADLRSSLRLFATEVVPRFRAWHEQQMPA